MISVYQKKKFKYLDLWIFDFLKLKIYVIEDQGFKRCNKANTGAAQEYAASNLKQLVKSEGGDHGMGFGILHYSEKNIWLLLRWWAHGDIGCQVLARSNHKLPTHFASMEHRPLNACVWEDLIIHHENQAWVNTMMTKSPSEQQYLAKRLPDGLY